MDASEIIENRKIAQNRYDETWYESESLLLTQELIDVTSNTSWSAKVGKTEAQIQKVIEQKGKDVKLRQQKLDDKWKVIKGRRQQMADLWYKGSG